MERNENGWVGTTHAADHLGVTVRTLYRLIDGGQVPAYKIGRVVRLRLADLDEFIASARIAPGALGHLYPNALGSTHVSEQCSGRVLDEDIDP